MNQWLVRVQDSLDKALEVVEAEVPKENMYMLAPIRYSEVVNMILNQVNNLNFIMLHLTFIVM